MMKQQNVNSIINASTPEEAVSLLKSVAESAPDSLVVLLDTIVASDAVSSPLLIEVGKLYWGLDMRGAALSAYERAATLDPDGPAKLLLEHSNAIMDFFNPDLLNP
jgi:tetratricopeptide (TPR) repeat protein